MLWQWQRVLVVHAQSRGVQLIVELEPRACDHLGVLHGSAAPFRPGFLHVGVAALSVYDKHPLPLAQYDGELLTKEVSITANVEQNGSDSEQSLVLTLQKAVLNGSDGMIEGNWVVAKIS